MEGLPFWSGVENGSPAPISGCGYLIIECDRPERATEIAARWPNARFCAMEVRPVMDTSGAEM